MITFQASPKQSQRERESGNPTCLFGAEFPAEADVPDWVPFVGDWHHRPWPCPTAVAAGAETPVPDA